MQQPEPGQGRDPLAHLSGGGGSARRPSTSARRPSGGGGSGAYGKLILLAILGMGVYGGYYGYSKYKAGDKRYQFDRSLQNNLRQSLLKAADIVDHSHIKAVVTKLAKEAGVQPDGEIKTIIEEMTPESRKRLSGFFQRALGMADKMLAGRDSQRHFIVAFEGNFIAKYGLVTLRYPIKKGIMFDHVNHPNRGKLKHNPGTERHLNPDTDAKPRRKTLKDIDWR